MQNETVAGVVNIAGNFNGWGNTPMTNVFGSHMGNILITLKKELTTNINLKMVMIGNQEQIVNFGFHQKYCFRPGMLWF